MRVRCAYSMVSACCIHGGQRTALKSQFSPVFVRVPRMELGLSDLGHGPFPYRATP